NWPRLHSADFRMKSLYGKGLDWPISYDDLRPYYDRIQTEVGVSGDHVAEVWRPAGAPYPMPALKTFRHAEVIAEGMKKLGMRVAPLPSAITSVPYKGRPACIYDGWCQAGCPIGALANPQTTYLPLATKAGAEIRVHSTATRILVDAKGDRAVGVEYYDRQKQKHVQRAKAVVLAGFVVQNSRLLLNSATDKHPNGLANSSGLLGRYIMCHSLSGIWGLFDEDVQNHMGITGGLLMTQDGYDKTARPDMFGSTMWQIGFAQKPNDIMGLANARVPLFGKNLTDFMKRAVRGLTKLTGFNEQKPDADNRIVLAGQKDERGMPLAEVVHGYDDDALKLWRHMNEEGLRIMKSAGAAEAWAAAAPGGSHLHGGTIMGLSPSDSVANSYGQTHDVPNLIVAGSSLFPTEGAVNPTFTIHAVSLRSAEYVAQHWGGIAR
ncbi:MAG: GMC family oxidoreductase N-terminal domain-containing protein, partial [Stellaceae bacterium]